MGSISPAVENIFKSKLPDIPIDNSLTLHDYIFKDLALQSHLPCLIDYDSGTTYSYAETDLYSRRLAAGLHNLGIRQGDVVFFLLPNCTAYPISFFATSRLGAVATTANPYHTPAEIAKQATAAGSRLIITEIPQLEKVRPLGLPIVIVDDGTNQPLPEGCVAFSDLMASDEKATPEVEIHPDDMVALPYSSGTTGLPKGVMLTHRSLVTNISQQVEGENPNMYLDKEDVILSILPMFHIYSINTVLLCGMRSGAAIVIIRKFNIAAMLEAVQRYKVTFAPLVPPIVVEMTKSSVVDQYDLSTVRMIMSGAAPMGKELQDVLLAKFPNATIGQGYGMTEAGPVLSLCPAFAKKPIPAKSGSCGVLVRNAELKVLDPESGLSLPRNKTGEICIRGDQLMKGYLNDPAATERTIDAEGWLHTGDIGYVDDDDEIFIVDRLKELIKYKGYQVAPAEIEALLIANPDIIDAAVVSMKDDLCGEIPVAFIVCSKDSEISEEDIKLYIKKQVVFYKRIHKVFYVDTIPKASSGKILRKELRARLEAHPQAPNGDQKAQAQAQAQVPNGDHIVQVQVQVQTKVQVPNGNHQVQAPIQVPNGNHKGEVQAQLSNGHHH